MITGKYAVVSKNIITGEEVVKHTQDNLITDYGMNYFGDGSKTKTANQAWSLKDCGVWLKDFADPTEKLEELRLDYLTGLLQNDIRTKFVYDHNSTPVESNNVLYDDGKVCYIETTNTYTFDQGAIVGDMYGAYIGCVDDYGTQAYINYNDQRMYPWLYSPNRTGATYIYDRVFSIFSALKFRDASGAPKVIPVEPIEQIFIKYTLRRYLPKYVAPKVFNFETEAGTTHSCKIEPTYWDNNYNGFWSSSSYRNAFSKFKTTYADKYEGVTVYNVAGTGSSYPQNNNNMGISVQTYIPYSYKQNIVYNLGIECYNQPIAKIDFYNSMGAMRATFTPPVPKNNTLATTFTLGWGWGREEDLITNFTEIPFINSDFNTDLSDWSLSETSPLIHYTEHEKSVVSLRVKNTIETLSQTLDVSSQILENRRITVQYKTEGSFSTLFNIVLTYLDSEDSVLIQDIVSTSSDNISNINDVKFIQKDVPLLGITAQKIKVTFTLKTNNTENAFISLTDLRFLLNNVTPIKG